MEINEVNDKLDFFLEQQVKIHIDLRDGVFLNGTLIKKVKDNLYWLMEDKLGEIFVFSKEIVKLQQYRFGEGKE